MLSCEGYKMFQGYATVRTLPDAEPREFYGTWLYKPTTEFWYVNGCKEFPYGTSFHKSEVEEIDEEA